MRKQLDWPRVTLISKDIQDSMVAKQRKDPSLSSARIFRGIRHNRAGRLMIEAIWLESLLAINFLFFPELSFLYYICFSGDGVPNPIFQFVVTKPPTLPELYVHSTRVCPSVPDIQSQAVARSRILHVSPGQHFTDRHAGKNDPIIV
jgi:hypothetical protein